MCYYGADEDKKSRSGGLTMPELPEVETVRTVLYPFVVGQTVTQVAVNLPKVVANLSPSEFVKNLTGQTITDLTRRGKFLTLHLQSGDYVVLHFRMTGTLTVEDATVPCQKHTNLVLTFANGQTLRYIDSRGFGHWWYYPQGAQDTSGQQNLGIEPPAVTVAYLQQTLAHRQTALKTLLLDQHIVAGIGNIYADEICFRARILPTRRGNSLTTAELTRLATQIPSVIAEFIQFHHVPFAVYAQSQGTSYQDDSHLAVYGRKGQPCQNCGQPLTGSRIGQRSSVFCTHCQK
ncbi:MAG: bifunctional DNA-formamidopyrimidine glycosylase/DNA-(apurinic or apyrimidinic site) lyase [Prevotella sp.]|nr:bifunctional DNA-formamidopyrimidine glycosylase/DNA-(apurinic or apyrimidinic site) lyase [Prevotella sp.]